MSSYAYISRVTRTEDRPLYMTLLEGSSALGCIIGLLGGGMIQTHTGLSTVGFVSAGMALAPFLSTLVFTVELPRADNHNASEQRDTDCMRRIGLTRMLDAIRCVQKRRDDYKRLQLNLCYIAVSTASFSANGLGVNSFLYYHKQNGLTLSGYTLYFAYIMAVVAVGGPLILKLTNSLKLNPATRGALAAAFVALGYCVMALDFIPHGMWIGGAFIACQSVVYASARSYATQLVRVDEIGKVFAYDAMLQVILQISSTILFKWVYSVTVEHWAGFFVALCGFLLILSSISLLLAARLSRATQTNANGERTPLLS